jgi:hypothetical protein
LIRQTKFGYQPKTFNQPESRTSIFEPTLGFDGGQAPQELLPGFTPASKNFVHRGGYLEPRSGLSRFDSTFQLGEPALWGMEAFDIEGRRYGIAASAGTVACLRPEDLTWSALSRVSSASDQAPNGSVENGWDGASIYEPASDSNIAVFTNNRQLPKFAMLRESSTTYSDFTWALSHFSRARSVCEVDNRLVFFNVSTSSVSLPQTLYWSSRGDPLDFTFTNGAGSEQLADMRGVGQRVIPDGDSIVLFTDEQIWRGRVRRDAYAFDFYCVSREMGCPYPKTIAETPKGLVFLGRDLELYVLNGDQTIPLGPTHAKPTDVGDHSRIQLYLQRKLLNGELAWGAYDSAADKYTLYFTTNESATNLWPTRAIDFNFDNRSYFIHDFTHELTAGFEVRDTTEASTWDANPYTWDAYSPAWDDAGSITPKIVTAWSSAGTPYSLRSNQTSDDGTAIDARWRCHGLSAGDALRYDQLYEVWMEYESETTSNVSLFVSGNVGSSFIEGSQRSLSAASLNVQLFTCNITAQSPLFEIRSNDGSRPRISRFQARLRDGGMWGGA